MQPTGGVFFKHTEGLDARKLIAKICDDGQVTTEDARAASGSELVGFAVHPPRGSFWAIVDSADGALGIGTGDWSKVSLAANHLGTDAIWYRTYAIDLGLAVYFPRGGTWMCAYAGVADDVIRRLEADGLPVHDSQPPASAASDALVVAVRYEPGRYASGPDRAVATRMLALHEALVAGEAQRLRALLEDLPEEDRALALAIVRGADRGDWRACLQRYAAELMAEPPRLRVKLGKLTIDEEILRRAAELATTEAELAAPLAHLEAIEADAGVRSAHSHPAGVAKLAYRFDQRGDTELALLCTLALLRRPEPAWYTCNSVLGILLRRTPFAFDERAREAIRLVEARLPELGQSAIDAITYNLACVLARGGDAVRAMAALRRCTTPREQNPHPEQDTDLELLWNDDEFTSLIAPRPAPAAAADDDAADDDADDTDDDDTYVVPPEHAEPRFEIALSPRPDAAGALIDRLGGKPNAPSTAFAWPTSPRRPMQLIAQLVGTAGGGTIELGNIHVLQIFADLEGDFYEEDYHAVVVHRVPCPAVVEPPVTVPIAEVQAIALKPGFDDRRLVEDEDFDSDEAHGHAWCDKLFGVPVGGNLDPTTIEDRLILELVSYDDWFLWALFANEELTEFRLDVVRG